MQNCIGGPANRSYVYIDQKVLIVFITTGIISLKR